MWRIQPYHLEQREQQATVLPTKVFQEVAWKRRADQRANVREAAEESDFHLRHGSVEGRVGGGE